MAAIDLSAVTNVPYMYSQASVGTTWQEVKLPPWCCRVAVISTAAAYVGFIGSETPSDGGAVGTHKAAIPQDTAAPFVIQDAEQRPIRTGLTYARSVFVAAQTGTATVTVIIETGAS